MVFLSGAGINGANLELKKPSPLYIFILESLLISRREQTSSDNASVKSSTASSVSLLSEVGPVHKVIVELAILTLE